MTLTRDELKDIMKACNLSATGFERRLKAGKIYCKHGTLSTNKSESSNRSYFIDPRSIKGSPSLTASYQRDHTSCKYLSSVHVHHPLKPVSSAKRRRQRHARLEAEGFWALFQLSAHYICFELMDFVMCVTNG